MPDKHRIQSPYVRRITIDEKLADGLIRILVALLKTGAKEFDDSSSYWNKEKEFLIQPDNYRRKMNIPPANAKEYPWQSLFEGQTFLEGNFQPKPGKLDEPRFLVDAAKVNFLCTFDSVKENIKQVYFSALKGGDKK